MGFDPITIGLIVSATAAVVGGGVAAYGSYQTGKTNAAIASFNAASKEKEGRLQLMAMQTQANIQKTQAEQEFALRQQEAQARFNNAVSIENQAVSQDKINRVNLTRRREAMEREAASARANIAASGAVESTGTPLDILAETAATIQRDQEEQHYTNEIQRGTLLAEAAQERLGGSLALAGATMDRNSGVTAAALNQAAAKGNYLAGLRESQIMRFGGKAAKRAGAIQAGASLLGGVERAASYTTS